jgi:hypothetical protein
MHVRSGRVTTPSSGLLPPLSAPCGPVAAQLSRIRMFAQIRPRATSELRPVVILELEVTVRGVLLLWVGEHDGA